MSLTIWKYPIFQQAITEISMPTSGRVLCVQTQRNKPYIWVLADPKEQCHNRRFSIVPTGFEVDSVGTYIGTFQMFDGAFVGHLFEDPIL